MEVVVVVRVVVEVIMMVSVWAFLQGLDLSKPLAQQISTLGRHHHVTSDVGHQLDYQRFQLSQATPPASPTRL